MQDETAWLVRRVLPPVDLERTAKAAAAYLDGGLSPPDVRDALCSTHWMPLDGREPRHELEASVLAIGRAALAAELPPLRACPVRGLEWWLQEQWPDDAPKEMHTDVSIGLSPGGAVSAHPLASSVTYLANTGGPTAVFDQRPTEVGGENWALPSGGALQPATPTRVALCLPSRGNLLVFVGDLFHGVMHTPPPPLGVPPTDEAPRRTLLVNFWGEQPPGAVDMPLPQLEARHAPAKLSAGAPCVMAPRVAVHFSTSAFADHAEHWKRQALPPEVSSQLARGATSHDEEGGDDSWPLLVVHYSTASHDA